ncbi:MAG TPA: hypothetical protein VKR78_01665 [Acidimicrobiales bacterium]|nr:hypothetical protein [Acidimicrobiales bacterium]
MPRRLVVRVASAVVIAGLAVAGFVLRIPLHRPDPQKLATLAVTSPVAGLRGHASTKVADPATSALAPVKSAAAATPGETGAFAVDWKGTGSVTAGSLELITVPTATSARAVLGAAKAADLAPTALTTLGYGFGARTHVTGIPGAEGAYYLGGTKPTITASTPRASVVVFGVGRVVVDVTANGKGAVATRTARAVAASEYRHLRRVGADPVVGSTVLPVVASLVYALVALAVLAIVWFAPGMVATARRRREELHREAERRARVARGSKVVRRHASHGYAGRVQARAHGRR